MTNEKQIFEYEKRQGLPTVPTDEELASLAASR